MISVFKMLVKAFGFHSRGQSASNTRQQCFHALHFVQDNESNPRSDSEYFGSTSVCAQCIFREISLKPANNITCQFCFDDVLKRAEMCGSRDFYLSVSIGTEQVHKVFLNPNVRKYSD